MHAEPHRVKAVDSPSSGRALGELINAAQLPWPAFWCTNGDFPIEISHPGISHREFPLSFQACKINVHFCQRIKENVHVCTSPVLANRKKCWPKCGQDHADALQFHPWLQSPWFTLWLRNPWFTLWLQSPRSRLGKQSGNCAL